MQPKTLSGVIPIVFTEGAMSVFFEVNHIIIHVYIVFESNHSD